MYLANDPSLFDDYKKYPYLVNFVKVSLFYHHIDHP